jgi:hypothetical protein
MCAVVAHTCTPPFAHCFCELLVKELSYYYVQYVCAEKSFHLLERVSERRVYFIPRACWSWYNQKAVDREEKYQKGTKKQGSKGEQLLEASVEEL